MKSSIVAWMLGLGAALCAPATAHAATYAFATNPYPIVHNYTPPCSAGVCADFTTAMRVHATFDTAAPLAPNLASADIRALLTGFTLTTGLTTYSLGDPAVRMIDFKVSTSAAGELVGVSLHLQRFQDGAAGPHASGARNDYFNYVSGLQNSIWHNARCINVAALSGVADACVGIMTEVQATSHVSSSFGFGPVLLLRLVPGAPTIVSATPGGGTATVTFSPPASDGGEAITGYTATCGAQSATGAGPSIVVPGLAYGVPVNCTVTATNSVGTSLPSGALPVTPFTVPGAPVIGTVTAGNGQATVNFTPPGTDGGSPITVYTATCGTQSASGTGSPLVVTGLVNGTPVNCSVVATNAAGPGAPSASVSVTPFTSATAPVIGIVAAGNGQATVNFSPPASNGGSPITGYTATCGTQSASGPGSPIVVTGLVNGVAVNCFVVANNAGGASPPSASVGVTPVGPPAAPAITTAVPGNGQATISFTPPASDGGLPVTSYTATCGAQSASGPSSPLTVTGLANGTAYACTVRATNSAGMGPPSAPFNVAPSFNVYTAPSATGSGTITASFTGGGAGCSYSVPRYIGAPPGTAPIPATAPANVTFPHGLFDFSLVGCTPGSTVSFTIVYPAALPASTQYWKYGPTPGNATPQWYVLPATIAGSTITFTLTDGGLGDDDLLANGTIVDQGGPGVPGLMNPVQTPTLSEWALMLMALLIVLTAAVPPHRRVGKSRGHLPRI